MNGTETAITEAQHHSDYLCQVRSHVSCSACCGLYNRIDASKDTLETILKNRTNAFSKVERTLESILAFGKEVELREAIVRKYPDFHHCPYIGLIGQKQSRTGCLLHPLSVGNNGIDFRGLSYYGGLACSTYFCPASRHMSSEIMRIIQLASDHWYIYGLMITEKELLEAFFKELEQFLNRPVTSRDFKYNPGALKGVRNFLYLKDNWPFRPNPHTGPCNYFFNDRKYQKSPVTYHLPDASRSRYDFIFKELVSAFDSKESLQNAESAIHSILENISQAI